MGGSAQGEAWMRQWESAARELAEQRRKDLAALTEARALAASEAVLALVGSARLRPGRRTHSGLVEQQAILHRRCAR